MIRDVDARLDAWMDGDDDTPLAVTGIRGCGRTHAVKEMIRRAGAGVYLDFDIEQLDTVLSDGMDASRMMSVLSRKAGTTIEKDTVVVVDGVNTISRMGGCLRALNRLSRGCRLVVVGGSHGMFGPGYTEIGMSMLSLDEFISYTDTEPERAFREYLAVGGLPGAVRAWRESGNASEVDLVLESVAISIMADATKDGGELATAVLRSIPLQLSRRNTRFMYSRVASGARSKGLIRPVDVLEGMGVVTKIPIMEGRGTGNGIPAFKLYCTDPGITRVLYGMSLDRVLSDDGRDGISQALMGTAVLGCLKAAGYTGMYSWRSGNRAEAEFVVPSDSGDIPFQVDSVRTAIPRSLKEYASLFDPEVMVHVYPGASGSKDRVVRASPWDLTAVMDALRSWCL